MRQEVSVALRLPGTGSVFFLFFLLLVFLFHSQQLPGNQQTHCRPQGEIMGRRHGQRRSKRSTYGFAVVLPMAQINGDGGKCSALRGNNSKRINKDDHVSCTRSTSKCTFRTGVWGEACREEGGLSFDCLITGARTHTHGHSRCVTQH